MKSSTRKVGEGLLHEIHEMTMDLSTSGVVRKQTIREIEALYAAPVSPLTPEQIRALREREGVSQAVLAHYMNVTPNAVSQWERGAKRPAGSALKLLWLAINNGLESIH